LADHHDIMNIRAFNCTFEVVSSYFRFRTSHTTTHAIRHVAVLYLRCNLL